MPEWMWKKLWKRDDRAGKSRRSDDRGVSFVEVVVSMLIMAIAVIPLLGSFMMSLRVNMKSRQAMSATIVAQNVMECVKEYANDKVVETNVGTDIKEYLPREYVDGAVSGDEGYFATSGDGFTLSNVKEGMNHYSVNVTYNQTVFTEINKKGIPDLTTLDADSTFVVCPGGVTNGSLEGAAKTYFYDEWLSAQWQYHAGTEGYTGPGPSEILEAQDDIARHMTSELTVEVSGTKEAPTATAVLRYHYNGMSYSGYSLARESGKGKLENIYIFYDPLQISGDSSSGYRIDDMVQVKNPGGFAWNLFFVVQEGAQCIGPCDAENLSGPVFATDWPYIGEKVALYCSTVLDEKQKVGLKSDGMLLEGSSALEDKNSLLALGTHTRMQRVTVEVYRQGTGERLATMESDIMQ